MAKVKDGFYHAGTGGTGSNNYLLKAAGGYVGLGSGNGLDADTVDGKHASDFATSGHNHDGRYLRYEGWWTSGNGNNVNDANGMVFVYGNHGSPNGWGILTTFDYTYNSSYKMQLFSNGYDNGYTYYRNRSADRGGWNAWVRFLDSSNYTEYVYNKSTADGRYLSKVSNDSTSYQYEFTKTNDHAIKVGTIRGRAVGSRTGEYIHLYERVHIGSPNGWGSNDAPSYGLSTYGGAWLATNTGSVGIGTTSPSYKLHVSGGYLGITYNSGTLYIGSGNTSFYHFVGDTSRTFYFSNTSTFAGTVYPYSNDSYNLGTTSYEWDTTYTRYIDTRHIDSSANYTGDNSLYIGYGGNHATTKTLFYYSPSTSSRTQYAEINSNGLYALTRFGVNGQNTSYNLYVNGTSKFQNTIYTNKIGTWWSGGMSFAAIQFGDGSSIDASSYWPFWSMKDSNGNVINFGGLGTGIGFYGYKASRTENGYDWRWVVDINSGIWSTLTAEGYIKNGSSNDYVLLGGGGHKAVSDFATSSHNHDSVYYKHFGTTNLNPNYGNSHLYKGYGTGMSTQHGVPEGSGYWFHIFSSGWEDNSNWISQIAIPTSHYWTSGSMWYRTIQGSNYAWRKVLDNNNTYVSSNKGYINGTEITQVNNADTVDNVHANRFAYTYNSNDYGSSSGVSVNDLVTNGVSNASHGMIYNSTDNPTGGSKWVHVWSQQWSIGTTGSWVSQLAIGTQDGTGMWYRTNGSSSIVGRGWTRVIDSSNISSQSVLYAGGAGNADTVDYYHKTDLDHFNLDYWYQNGSDPSILEVAINENLNNKFYNYDTSKISVEKSTDGSTFNTMSLDTGKLKNLLGGTLGTDITIEANTYLRFTFTPVSYCYLNSMFLYYCRTNGSLQVKIEKRACTTDTFTTVKDWAEISGWPGTAMCQFGNIAFTNSSSSSYCDRLRITFHGTNSNHYLYRMRVYGGYPNTYNSVISVDGSGMIYNSSYGNSATATKLQTARTLTIGNTGKSFDGSSNVSWSLSEIGVDGNYVKKIGDTMTGQLYINYDQDVGLNQNGSLVIGYKGGENIAIDGNEIMARNNSSASTLYLQAEGGNLYSSAGTNYFSGNVGIGTASPRTKLHIKGDLLIDNDFSSNDHGIFFRSGFESSNKYNVSILAYDHNGSGNSPDGLSINGYDGISFCTGSNNRNEIARITVDGNVGIGTTSPSYKFHVVGAAYVTEYLKTGGESNTKGINLNDAAWINNIGSQVIFRGATLRFGGSGWDWDAWAGLKFDGSKTIYIGMPDNSQFTANTPKTDGTIRTVNSKIEIFPNGNGNYGEGIRIHSASNGWTTFMLCGSDNTALNGTSANSWSMHTYGGEFYLNRNNSSTASVNRLWARNAGGFTLGNLSWSSYTLEVGGVARLSSGLVLGGYTSYGDHYITGAAGRIYFGGNFHIDSIGRADTYDLYLNYYGQRTIHFQEDKILMDSSGRFYPGSTSSRRAGYYGNYDSYKIAHIWSISRDYCIPDDGSNFGSIYGLAYKHTNNGTGGTMAGGHQIVFATSGDPKASLGENGVWAKGGFYKKDSNNDYVLLGGGGHKAESSLNVSNADTVDGYHSYNLYTSFGDWIDKVENTKVVTVNGDKNTYYPVRIPSTGYKNMIHYISVWRNLGGVSASYLGNHNMNGDGVGGVSCWYLFEGRNNTWDGNGGYFATLKAWYGYAPVLSHADAPGGPVGDLIVWLRGGGTTYNISCTYPFGNPTVYYESTNIGTSSPYERIVAPRTDIGNAGKIGKDYYGGTFYGNASSATNATYVSWNGVTGKPDTATRWPTWGEVTDKPSAVGSITTPVYWTGSGFSTVQATFGNGSYGEHNASRITSNGLWYYTSNGPSAQLGARSTDGALYSQAYDSSWVGQIAQDYRDGGLYVRGKNNGTWQKWLQVMLVDLNTSAISDCNSVYRSGIYTSGGFSNRPSDVSDWGTLVNYKLYESNNNYHRQVFFDCYSSDRIWTRSKSNGSWTGWVELVRNTGTWNINITGNAATATSAGYANSAGDSSKLEGLPLNRFVYSVGSGDYGTSERTGNSENFERTMFWRDNDKSAIGLFVAHSYSSDYGWEIHTDYGRNSDFVGRIKENGTWGNTKIFITSANISSQSVNYATSAGSASSASSATWSHYLSPHYDGGQQTNPQQYFNYGIGLKVAMTGVPSTWCDTLWINGYTGGDVPNMCALHFRRNGTPRFYISTQSNRATSYGTMYEVLTSYNWSEYITVSSGGNDYIWKDSQTSGTYANKEWKIKVGTSGTDSDTIYIVL